MKVQFRHYPNRQYPWQWYYSPQGPEFNEVYKWLWKTYGNIDEGRWSSHGGQIMFRDEKDAIMFTLRWT